MRLAQSLTPALLVSLFVAGTPAVVSADATTFRFRADGGSRVQFVSDAPLETITGVTTNATGEATFDPASLASARGRIEVGVASLRTGVDLRDEHLRSADWLDSRRFPQATFEITRVEGAETLVPNQSTQVRLRGRFTLHGVARDVQVQARVRWIPLTDEMRRIPGMNGDVLMVNGSFTVHLTDFGVSVPAVIRLKVADEVRVDIRLRAIAATS